MLITRGKDRETISLTIDDDEIQSSLNLKSLGVWIDACLRFDDQLQIIDVKIATWDRAEYEDGWRVL